jgi:hypothetical protein
MPYLRLYASDVPLWQKRLIAQELIEITLRAFQLRAEDRHRITIQFIPLPQFSVAGLEPVIPQDADFFLEVNDHGLTEEKKRVFTEEVKPMLAQALGAKPRSRFAQLQEINADISRPVALQFNELNPDELTGRDSAFVLEHRAA